MAQAQALCEHILEVQPVHFDALILFGAVMLSTERWADAAEYIARALRINSNSANGHYNLGLALQGLGKHAEAVGSYDKAIALNAGFSSAWFNRGNALAELRQWDAALDSYDNAVAVAPDHAAAWFQRGRLLKALGRFDSALESYDHFIALKPDHAVAHNNRGNILIELNRLEEALTSFDQALAFNPGYAIAHNNRGNVLKSLNQPDQALASYDQAIRLAPGYALAFNNRGNVLKDLMRLDEAVTSYRSAVAIRPDYAVAYSNLLFTLTHHEQMKPHDVFAEHRKFGERFNLLPRGQDLPHLNDREVSRRLRVGFVSGDFRQHAVAGFIEPVWAALDAAKIELFAYSNHHTEDPVTHRLRALCRHWTKVVNLSDTELAHRIRDDKIDILFDLSGHTAHNRLTTFACKPAPVQVTWIGYPNTTGLSAMDYVICDRFNAPPGLYEHFYVEKFCRIPTSSAFGFEADAPPVNALPALSKGYLTLANFSRPAKLSDSVIGGWCRVLHAIPDSRMLIGNVNSPSLADRLSVRFGEHGISSERLLFQAHKPFNEYLSSHHGVDFILDTWPYTGGTTSNLALWMGVPTLTLTGDVRAHRQSAALLGRVGLDDWVARDADDFVRLAVNWGHSLYDLAQLRADMRRRLQTAPLRQPATVARGLERAMEAMWARWCAGLPADHIEITADAIVGKPSSH